ncbi:MAG: type II toxin-antitoxin system RelE/ParE family toxin [Deltaproteobacteria bacterium]|nr:type II toxin-antitoxin system RelE/ParE family toxin [Deltaproteobacteria bacterium]
MRIGDYRVIYEIDEKEKAVRIMRVRHHREVYRR